MIADCQTFILFLQIAARVVLMFMVSIGAILSIYWGWKLYRDIVVASQVSGELQTKGFTFKFASAGPGIVLAGFGAWLLSLVATHPMSFNLKQAENEHVAWYQPSPESMLPGFIKVGAALPIQKNDISRPASTAASPEPVAKCRCQPLRRSSSTEITVSWMGGSAKEPSNLDILHSLQTAIDLVRKSSPASVSMDKEILRTLDSLEYLKDLAQHAAAQEAVEQHRAKAASKEQ